MERNTQKNGLVNLLVLLAAAVSAYAVAHYSGSLSGVMTVAFMILGVLVAGVSWFQMRLEERERLEKLEFDELAKTSASSALFNAAESEVFPAQRSREQFERFFVPAFTFLLFVMEIGAAIALSLWFKRLDVIPLRHPEIALGMFSMFFLLLFLLGRYATNLARLEGLRLFRPGATCLLLNAYICLLALVGIGGNWMGFTGVDRVIAQILAGLLFFIGVETLITLLLEMYRPRVKGKVERPLYESRVVSVLGQPEGLFTTAWQTLDYQFGFKVSETWVFRLLARWLPWLVAAQLGVLLLSTTVVFVEPGEQAVHERYGKFYGLLGPGAHFKLPWPLDRTIIYPTDLIQTLDVGFVPDKLEAEEGNTILWTVPHANEENFVVANRATAPAAPVDTNDTGNHLLPFSLLTVSIPVQYQVTNLEHWVYHNDAPQVLLEDIATREVVHFMVSADLNEIMSWGRLAAAEKLRAKIQAGADAHGLGVKIVLIGLQDIHPPVKVAPDYEKSVAALHTTNALIRMAVADSIRSNTDATVRSLQVVSEAQSESLRRVTNAVAQADLFNYQLQAYRAAPSVYMQRTRLDTLAQAITNARTYVIYPTNLHQVSILNLEDKLRADFLDTTLPQVRTTTNSNSSTGK